MRIPQLLSTQKMRRPRFDFVCLHMLLVAIPFGIEHTAGDSSETNVHLSFGQGNYAAIVQGCEDTEPSSKHQFAFGDIGLQVDHLTASHFRLGIRGSYIFDESTEVTVINPFVNIEQSWRVRNYRIGRGLTSRRRLAEGFSAESARRGLS